MLHRYFLLGLACLLGVACSQTDSYDPARNYQDRQEEILTQFILAEDSSVIELPEGHFLFSKSLILDGKNHVVIRGKGMDKTVLSFKGQTEGAEGVRIANCTNIVLEDLTVEDATGDNVKATDTDTLTFRRVKVAWTGPIDAGNGAYGLYPVICKNVLIEECETMGASDAGLYVGQSENVIVRNNKVYQNVAGIESENSTDVEIYNNECWDNTSGILVFNLPGLTRYGGRVKVYDNVVRDNNRDNFAVKGAIVSFVPPGSGITILATKEVEVMRNQILDHSTVSLSVVSYELFDAMMQEEGKPVEENTTTQGVQTVRSDYRSFKDYDPYPGKVKIYENTYQNSHWFPNLGNDFGKLFAWKLRAIPDVAVDGIHPPNYRLENGQVSPDYQICVQEKDISFAYLDLANDLANFTTDIGVLGCNQ